MVAGVAEHSLALLARQVVEVTAPLWSVEVKQAVRGRLLHIPAIRTDRQVKMALFLFNTED
jgi:hypothetical protein